MPQGLAKNCITNKSFKGCDQLCKVVELSMQCCGKLLLDSFETYYTLKDLKFRSLSANSTVKNLAFVVDTFSELVVFKLFQIISNYLF